MLQLLARISAQNSTLHGVQEGWKPEPVGRGTWSILWACLSTLWICTYSVNRYDVQTRPIGLGLKIFLFLQTLFAPEYACYMALEDFQRANTLTSWIKQRKDVEGAAKWTLRHSFFFAMGGAAYHRYDEYKHTDLVSWSHTANDDGENNNLLTTVSFSRATCKRYVIRYRHLPAMISDDRIAALSKNSWLLDLIAILQTGWTAAQCVTRASLGLDTAPIEFLTISYIPVFLATAILWWKKPLLEASVMTIPVTSQFDDGYGNLEPDNAGTTSTGPDDAATQSSTKKSQSLPFLLQMHFGGIFPGLILCGLHLLAWNTRFPTKVESMMWRVCCFVSIASCLLYGFCFVVYHTRWLRHILKITWIGQGGDEISFVLPYIIARFILVVLALLSLRSTPSGVYETVRWPQYIPHIH